MFEDKKLRRLEWVKEKGKKSEDWKDDVKGRSIDANRYTCESRRKGIKLTTGSSCFILNGFTPDEAKSSEHKNKKKSDSFDTVGIEDEGFTEQR